MKEWGLGLIGLGLLVVLVSIFLPMSVSTEEMTTLPYSGSVIGSGRFSDIFNLGRAQTKEMVFHGGCSLFLGGITLLVGGLLDARLSSLRVADGGPVPEGAHASLPEQPAPLPEPTPIAPVKGAVEALAVSDSDVTIAYFAGGAILFLVLLVGGLSFLNRPDQAKVAATGNATENLIENASRAADEAANNAINAAENAAAAAAPPKQERAEPVLENNIYNEAPEGEPLDY